MTSNQRTHFVIGKPRDGCIVPNTVYYSEAAALIEYPNRVIAIPNEGMANAQEASSSRLQILIKLVTISMVLCLLLGKILKSWNLDLEVASYTNNF